MNQADSRFRLSDDLARELAEKFGTPLYVVHEATVRDRVSQYKTALQANYPKTEVSYASKANSTFAVLKTVYSQGASIDVASEGELRAAMLAGIPASSCHLHGNNKKPEEMIYALEQGVSHIAIDNFPEIETISQLINGKTYQAKYFLRLAPGVDPKTHARISTGQSDTKFGFNITDGSAEKALLRCVELGIPVQGVHCHVGSQLMDEEAQRAGGEFLAEFAASMKAKHGVVLERIIVGGGLGVKYTNDDDPVSIGDYCQRIIDAMKPILAAADMQPLIGMEPGRSIVGEAGVTLYTVGVIKSVPIAEGKRRTYVAVDGGLSDNPRPAMYEAKYEVAAIKQSDNPIENQIVTVCGKHCETDNLFENVEVPSDLQVGDLLQVLSTGAYNSTMASNYNRYPRPATVLIRHNGKAELVTRRDSWEEMFNKELVPGDL